MPVPLPLAIPAAAAGLAYINAHTSFWYDALLVRSVIPATINLSIAKFRDRANLFYRLESNAKSWSLANHPFLVFEDKSYTYAQVYDRALRYGVWWKEKMGVKTGDVVAMNFMNSDTFVFLWMGLWSIGAKPAFINYNLRDRPLIHCVKTATTGLMLVDPAVSEAITPALREELAGTRIEIFTPELQAQAATSPATRFPDEVRHEDRIEGMAILIFTSGTTGLPKAAVVSWAKMIVSGTFSSGWIGTTKKDIYYTCMPLYHSSACLFCFSTMLHGGGTLAIGKRFSNKTFWPEVRQHKATIVQYVGETCRYLLAAPPQLDPVTGENLDKKHHVRTALGNGLRPDVWNPFKARFGIETIAEFYGATEGTLATFNLSRNDFSAGAVGRNGWLYEFIMGFSVAMAAVDWSTEEPLRDPKTGLCRRCRVNEPGELIFRLPANDVNSRFQGYYGNQKATDSKIMRDVFKRGDAWFRTGDIVRRDGNGLTYFHDRVGDTFRWRSENVSTTEVSHIVGLHPDVLEANVYGVAVPNHDGRAGCVALVLKKPATPEFFQSLSTHNEQGLPRYARPLFLRIVQDSSAHTTGTNKQQKHVLRDEGIDPSKVGSDQLFWLNNGTYKPFGPKEWKDVQDGLAKL